MPRLLLHAQFLALFIQRDVEESKALLDLLVRQVRHRCVHREPELGHRIGVVRNRLRGRRLAVLSHELRTPLNVILGWTQLLQRQRDTAAMERGLLVIDRNARLQAQLIEDLLDMSRIVSRTLRLELNELDPSELIHEQLEAMRPAAHAKAITLTMNAQAGIGRIRADRARLQQVLGNMLTNPLADR